MTEFEAYKKEANKMIKTLCKRNDLLSNLLRLKIREKVALLAPKENKAQPVESITFIGLNDDGDIV